MYANANSGFRACKCCLGYFTNSCMAWHEEDLLPLLFALFSNDSKSHLLENINDMQYVLSDASFIKMANDDAENYQMFQLLYADDTVCSDNGKHLQQAINILLAYCTKWHLSVNIKKTQIFIFFKGKICELFLFKFNKGNVEVVFHFLV